MPLGASGGELQVTHVALVSFEEGRAPPLLFSAASDARVRCFNMANMTLLFVLPHQPGVGVCEGQEFESQFLKAPCLLLGE